MAVVIDGTNNDITGLVEPLAVGAAVEDSDAVQRSQLNTLMTAQATTSGTSKDFTIPSWAKEISLIPNGVSGNGSSHLLVQLGVGGVITTSGYVSSSAAVSTSSANSTAGSTATSGFVVFAAAARTVSGAITIRNVSGNIWACSHALGGSADISSGGGVVSLAGTLDTVRLTTVNGTDTFDAGSVNVMYS